MGNKDRTKDGDAAASSTDNKDHSWHQESRDAALARTITIAVAGALAQQKTEETQSITAAVAGALRQQKSEKTQSIAEAVALQTKSITEAFSNKRQKRHSPSQKHSQGRWRRRMHSMRSF